MVLVYMESNVSRMFLWDLWINAPVSLMNLSHVIHPAQLWSCDQNLMMYNILQRVSIIIITYNLRMDRAHTPPRNEEKNMYVVRGKIYHHVCRALQNPGMK